MHLSVLSTSATRVASQKCSRGRPASAVAPESSTSSTPSISSSSFSSSSLRPQQRRRPRPLHAPSSSLLSRPVASAAAASDAPSSSPTPSPPPRLFRDPPPPPAGWEQRVSEIDARPLSRLVLALFRSKMALALGGRDSDLPRGSYDAIVDLTRRLNALPARETARKTRAILQSLFPSWLPGAFAVLFSRPLPYASARINAEATAIACAWLMGPTEVNDGGGGGGGGGGTGGGGGKEEEEQGGERGLTSTSTSASISSPSSSSSSSSSSSPSAGHRTGCKVAYCRYLASTGCVSACLNSCKLPTQRFFKEDMGLALRMTPNLEDFSCQFSFGVEPSAEEDEELLKGASCLVGCGILRGKEEQQSGSGGGGGGSSCCPGACQLKEEVEAAALASR